MADWCAGLFGHGLWALRDSRGPDPEDCTTLLRAAIATAPAWEVFCTVGTYPPPNGCGKNQSGAAGPVQGGTKRNRSADLALCHDKTWSKGPGGPGRAVASNLMAGPAGGKPACRLAALLSLSLFSSAEQPGATGQPGQEPMFLALDGAPARTLWLSTVQAPGTAAWARDRSRHRPPHLTKWRLQPVKGSTPFGRKGLAGDGVLPAGSWAAGDG